MIEVKFASDVEEYLIKIKRKDGRLFSRIDKQLELFVKTPNILR